MGDDSYQYEHNSFVLYRDSWTFVRRLSDIEAGRLFKSLFLYVIDGELPEFTDDLTSMSFELMRNYLDRDEAKYARKCAKNRQSALNRWGNNANAYERMRTYADKDKDRDSASDNDTGADIDNEQDREQDMTDIVVDDSVSDSEFFDSFRFKDLQKVITDNRIDLNAEGTLALYNEMKTVGWRLYDKPIERKYLVRAFREWRKRHDEYSKYPDLNTEEQWQ